MRAIGIALVASVLLGACATKPPRAVSEAVPASQLFTLELWTYEYSQPWGTTGVSPYRDPVRADCTLANDKGEWRLAAPGSVSVPHAVENLKIECVAPGLKPARIELVCITKKQQGQQDAFGGALMGAQILLPLMIATPAGAGVALGGAVALGMTGYGLSQAAAADANVCRYAAVDKAKLELGLWR
jgi:hypothetical protein